MDWDLDDALGEVSSREDLARFVGLMAEAASSSAVNEWENQSLAAFLEGLSAWLVALDGLCANQGLELPTQPTWRLMGDALLSATIYE